MSDQQKLRIDRWLWAARFYKTRALAAEAVSGGHVHVQGARVKPSKALSVGAQLVVSKAPFEFHITVLALSARRGPASEAQTLYRESEQSQQKRAELAEQRRQQRLAEEPSQHRSRPSKRDRRMIHRFRQTME